MSKNTIVTIEQDTIQPADLVKTVHGIAVMMQNMADMMRSTNERMASLEKEVRSMTKATPAQVKAINGAIRDRAVDLATIYRIEGSDKQIANAIRKAVRLTTGVNNLRELPRCEYSLALQQVEMWDDRKVVKGIKARGQHNGA